MPRDSVPGLVGERDGAPDPAPAQRRPTQRDFAGLDEAVGAHIRQIRPGDPVFGDLGEANGAFAEYVRVPETAVAPRRRT